MTDTDTDKVGAAVALAQAEILSNIAAGIHSPDVRSFSELHDRWDANVYGGLCDDGNTLTFDEASEVQDRVHDWLTKGRPPTVEQMAYDDLVAQGAYQIEATCQRCGATFMPGDRNDLIHIENDCGGLGIIAGGFIPQRGRQHR